MKQLMEAPAICKFSIIDLLLLVFVAIGGISQLIIHSDGINIFVLSRWCILIACYIAVRCTQHKHWVLWGIMLTGSVEAFLGFLQKLHWLDSHHSAFDITGTFGNPGPFGGFLAVTFVIGWGFYRLYSKRRFVKLILFVVILFTIIALVLSDSRAGWLAALSGCICIWYYWEGRPRFPLYVYVIFTLVIGILLAGAYFYKKDSADGRRLIWKVSANMIADAPLTGHGVGSFPKQYMYYQARYFKENPESDFKTLAGNVIYPYNEILRIGVEFGLSGILAILLLIAVIFRYALMQRENILLMGTFSSLCVFALFSYPSDVFLLLILFPLLIGNIQCDKSISLPKKRTYTYIRWGMYAISLFATGKACYEYIALESKMRELYISTSFDKRSDSKLYIQMHINELKGAPRLLDLYAQYSFLHFTVAESLPIVQLAASIVPTSEIVSDLGDLYRQQKRNDKAMEYYRLSSEMIPDRVIPKYKQFQLYRDAGDTIQMKKIGAILLSIPIKLGDTKTLQMRGEVKRELSSMNH